jgi:hypothetical protein
MMSRVKHEVVAMVQALPDEAMYDEIMAEQYFRQRVGFS